MTPGEELVDSLDKLRYQLNQLVDRLNKSGVERTNGLRTFMGPNCEFYRRSLDLLLKKDYIDLRNLVKSCNDLFNVVEGKSGQG